MAAPARLPALCARLGLPAGADLEAVACHLLGADADADADIYLTAMLEVCLRHALEMDAVDLAKATRWTAGDQRIAPETILELNRRGLLRGTVPVCMVDEGAIASH